MQGIVTYTGYLWEPEPVWKEITVAADQSKAGGKRDSWGAVRRRGEDRCLPVSVLTKAIHRTRGAGSEVNSTRYSVSFLAFDVIQVPATAVPGDPGLMKVFSRASLIL